MHYNAVHGWLISVPKKEKCQVNLQAIMDMVEYMQSLTTLPASTADHLAHYQ
jgi:hypothetical protein